MKNICLYVGSFDPPHIGHQTVVQYLLNQQDVDEVTIIPTFIHCHKDNVSNYHHRCQMLSRAFQYHTHVNISVVEKILVDAYGYKENRTNDTIKYLQEKNPTYKYHLALGSDLFNTISTWKNLESYSDIPIKVIMRNGYPIDVSNQMDIVELGIKYTIINPEMPMGNVSSSHIKEKIVKGESIRGVVPHQVVTYIYTHKDLLDTYHKSYNMSKKGQK